MHMFTGIQHEEQSFLAKVFLQGQHYLRRVFRSNGKAIGDSRHQLLWMTELFERKSIDAIAHLVANGSRYMPRKCRFADAGWSCDGEKTSTLKQLNQFNTPASRPSKEFNVSIDGNNCISLLSPQRTRYGSVANG